MDRFGCTASDFEIESLKEMSKNKNTQKATNIWMNCYLSWAKCRTKPELIEKLPPTELDCILQQFFAEIKTQKGDDYEPSSLCNMQAGIERYLKDNRYEFSILNSREFIGSRSVLEGIVYFRDCICCYRVVLIYFLICFL